MQSQAIADFGGGYRKNVDPTGLSANESPDMVNLVIDRGTLMTRFGRVRQGAYPATSPALSVPVRGIWEFVDSDLSGVSGFASNCAWVIACGSNLFACTAAGQLFTSFVTLGTNPISATNKIRAAQCATIGDDRLYLVDGVNPVQYWEPTATESDGNTSLPGAATALVSLVDQVAPFVAPAISFCFTNASPSVPYVSASENSTYCFQGQQIYQFACTYLYTEGGNTLESDIGPIASLDTNMTGLSYFAGLSINEASGTGFDPGSLPTGVTGFNLYAMGAGLGNGSQWVQMTITSTLVIPNGQDAVSTWYLLNLPANLVILDPYLNAPPVGCSLLFPWRSRMIYVMGNVAYYSNVGDPTRCPQQTLASMSTTYGFYIQIGNAGNIVSAFALGEITYYLLARGMYVVYGYDATTIQEPAEHDSEVGCISHESLCKVPGVGAIWLDLNDIWLFTGQGKPTCLVDHWMLDQFTLSQKQGAFAVYDSDQSVYMLTFPGTGDCGAVALWYHIRTGKWTKHAQQPGSCGLYSSFADTPGSYFADTTVGYLYQMNTGTTDDYVGSTAQPISWDWKSKAFLATEKLARVNEVIALAALLTDEGSTPPTLTLALNSFNGSLLLAQLCACTAGLDDYGQVKWKLPQNTCALYQLEVSGVGPAEIVALLYQVGDGGGR